jgi:hypothetical protein
MSSWFRWWHGSVSDPKFGVVSMRAKRPLTEVLAVWASLLESASQADDRGDVSDCVSDEIAWTLRMEAEHVESIIAALENRGMLCDGRIASWDRRQPDREDAISPEAKPVAQRVREHRERVKSACNADVTRSNADVTRSNAPEQNRTDTETEKSTPGPQHSEKSPETGAEISVTASPMPAAEIIPSVFPKADDGLQAACRDTWAAYSGAYADRYGVMPVRNAKANAAIKGVVRRLGAEESPAVARFFVGHCDAYYARRCHDVGLLQADAEKLRTEWASGRAVTSLAARQQERAGTMAGIVNEIIAERARA